MKTNLIPGFKKYLRIYQAVIGVSLEYRAELVVIVIQQIISLFGFLVVWIAILSDGGAIQGFDLQQMLTYYVLIFLVAFLTSVDVSRELGYKIRNGFLSVYLLKPFSIAGNYFMKMLSGKTVKLGMLLPIYIVVLGYLLVFAEVPLSIHSLSLGFAYALLGLLLSFVIDFFVSGIAFWVDDVWAFRHLKLIVFSILGGVSFPYELLPENLRLILEFLPFKYMGYVPVSYIMGTRNPAQTMVFDISLFVFWMLAFYLLNKLIWNKGIKKYEAYGN